MMTAGPYAQHPSKEGTCSAVLHRRAARTGEMELQLGHHLLVAVGVVLPVQHERRVDGRPVAKRAVGHGLQRREVGVRLHAKLGRKAGPWVA